MGVAISAVAGYILLRLSQPLTLGDGGKVNWNIGAFMVPVAALVITAVLGWSVFYLPVVLARRRGIVLDPGLWPATGAIAIGILLIVGFVGAILLGII